MATLTLSEMKHRLIVLNLILLNGIILPSCSLLLGLCNTRLHEALMQTHLVSYA